MSWQWLFENQVFLEAKDKNYDVVLDLPCSIFGIMTGVYEILASLRWAWCWGAAVGGLYTKARLSINTIFSRYRDSHDKDKTVVRLSYLYHNGNPYIGKTASSYWDAPMALTGIIQHWRPIPIFFQDISLWHTISRLRGGVTCWSDCFEIWLVRWQPAKFQNDLTTLNMFGSDTVYSDTHTVCVCIFQSPQKSIFGSISLFWSLVGPKIIENGQVLVSDHILKKLFMFELFQCRFYFLIWYHRSPLYWYGLTEEIIILAWVSNYIHYKMWDEITYPSPNFSGAAIRVWE